MGVDVTFASYHYWALIYMIGTIESQHDYSNKINKLGVGLKSHPIFVYRQTLERALQFVNAPFLDHFWTIIFISQVYKPIWLGTLTKRPVR